MKYQFGEKLREIRERKKMTMKDVAEKAGVTESLISQIERNKVSPAIDTLFSITEILEIDLEYLFSDFKRSKEVQLVHKDDRDVFVAKGVTYEQLSTAVGRDNEHGIEAYYLVIDPGKEKGSSEYGHVGMEMGIILQGKGELSYGKESYKLVAGDSLSFESDIPHIIKNTGSTPFKAYWVVTPPKNFSR
jgi:transcriptional regulator with XRE-family HTH domain